MPYPLTQLPVSRALKGRGVCANNIAIESHNGLRTLEVQATPIYDADDSVAYAMVTYQDISNQTPALVDTDDCRCSDLAISEPSHETVLDDEILGHRWPNLELNHSQSLLQHLAEAIPGVMFSLQVEADHSVTCEYLNRHVEVIFEASWRAIAQHPEHFLITQMHPDDRQQFFWRLARRGAAGQPFTGIWRSVTPSGRIRWLKASAQPEQRDHGAISWYGVLIDISQYELTKLECREEMAQSAAVLRAIPDLIVRVNRAGYYISYVHNNTSINVMPADVLIQGSHLSDYLPADIAEQQLHIIHRALETEQVQVCEQVLLVEGRQQYEEVRAVPCAADEVLLIIRDISDRKLAEHCLQQRETEYRKTLEALPDLMFRISRTGYWLGYVRTNESLDYLPADYDPMGHHISEYMPPEVAQLQLQKIEQAIASKQIQVFEQQLNIKGQVQYEEVRIVPQGTEEVLFIVRNITDRKTVEIALKKSEFENRKILSAIPDLIYRIDRDGTFLGYFKTGNIENLLGKEVNPIGQNMLDFACDESRQSMIDRQMQAIELALDSNEMQVYEQKVLIDSAWQHEEVRIVPAGAEEVLVIIRNVDDRKTAELALKQSEAQKKAILKAIPDLMFHMRQDGLILDYMLGRNFGDVLENGTHYIGRNIRDFADSEALSGHIPKKMQMAHRALETGELQIYEQVLCVDGVQQQEEVRIVPLTSDEVLVMIRDISIRKRMESELRTANDRLAKLSLTDSLTTLANRRKLDEHLQREWERSRREQEPLSFILFDLDFFKQFNDTYGHQSGDDCLSRIAQAVLTVVHRSSDLVARYGGEEFAVVLSNTHLKGAFTIGQRICEVIRDLKIPHATSEASDFVTTSIGVSAIIPTADNQPNVLIRQADQALYAAKQAGRDNCQCFVSR